MRNSRDPLNGLVQITLLDCHGRCHQGRKRKTEYKLLTTKRKMINMNKLDDCNDIMKKQLLKGKIEAVPPDATGLNYIPYCGVIREDAATKKLRVVYDCSAKPHNGAPSLNKLLHTGVPLQPLIFDVLLKSRFDSSYISSLVIYRKRFCRF